MRISEILRGRRMLASFEIFPPKRDASCDSAIATAGRLAALRPDFISVTYGAGGSSQSNTIRIADAVQREAQVPALAHLTCIGANEDRIREVTEKFKRLGIENVLALRGDLPPGMDTSALNDHFRHASDLVTVLKRQGFCVGGACYPEGHPESGNRSRDLDNLCRKVEAGCDFLTTQMVFDNDMLYSFLYQMQSRGMHVPVFAGIMPVTNANQIARMLELSNSYMPRKLLMIIDRFRDQPEALRQAGIEYAVAQIIDLACNGIRGIHLYTMNKADIAEAIFGNVNQVLAACR